MTEKVNPEELVKAKCGKMVSRKTFSRHEKLCGLCISLGSGGHNPAESRQADIQADRAAELDQSLEPEFSAGGRRIEERAEVAGASEGVATGAGATSEAEPPAADNPVDPIIEKVADKVLGVLSPALKQRFDEIALALNSRKMPTSEELQAMIKNEVKETITGLIEAKESASVGGTAGNGNGGGVGELGALTDLVKSFMQRQAPQGGGMSAQAMFDFMQKQWEAMNNAQRSGIDLVNTVMNAALKANRDVGAADVTSAVVENFHPATPPPTVAK